MKTPEHIGFVSTRFAGTDGVSLEAAKWAEVLWQDQHVSYWYAGVLDRDPGVSLCVPEAFFGHAENRWINEQLWGRTRRCPEASRRIRVLTEYLKGTLYEFRDRFDLDILAVENALTIPMHIPLGIALTEFLLETQMPAIAHHHDFHWERLRFQISAVDDYLEMAFPPRIPHLQHVVINQAARDQLGWRKGISSVLIPNVFDFEHPPPPPDDYAADVPGEIGLEAGDLLVLQPTRVVPRKGIEQSIHLVQRLRDPHCKLVVSHAAGDEGLDYCRQLSELARDEGVEMHLFGDRVGDRRQLNGDGRKIYVLGDLYPHADLVTFPSLYEGFGNALVEAFYYRKPVLVNRYSIFITDIEPRDFRVVTMDGYVTAAVVEGVRKVLQDATYREELTAHNFERARSFYSLTVLRRKLDMLLANATGD